MIILSALINSLAIYLSYLIFIAAAHASRADLEVDGSTISHTHNA